MRIKNGVPVDRIELTLDLINARVKMSDSQRRRVREVLTEQITRAVEEERQSCAQIAVDYYKEHLPDLEDTLACESIAEKIYARATLGS